MSENGVTRSAEGVLQGKVGVVTGAAGVLGEAIASALIADGMRVAIVDLPGARLDAATERLGGNAVAVPLDVSSPDDVAKACSEVERAIGPIDVLVNNAGILSNNKVATTELAEWRRVLAVNLDGPFLLTRSILPGMMERGWGRVVNVCSLASKTGGITAGTAYTTSKGGLAALTFSAAREAARRGVTVNGIAPAYVKTPMITEQLTEEQRQELLKQIPVGRFVGADEVAHVVRFLVHPMSGFITGEIIDVNGGLHFD